MEVSVLFTVTAIYGLRAGAVCVVFANRDEGKFEITGEETLAKVAAEEVKILNEWDSQEQSYNKKYLYPSLLIRK